MAISQSVLAQATEIANLHHERGALLDRRKKLTAEIDREIEKIEERLGSLIPTVVDDDEAPRKGPRQGSYKDRIMAFLADHPGSDYHAIARAIYGADDEESRNKTRSHIHILHKEIRVSSTATGRWSLVPRE